jgi:hypothetical protein
MQEYEAQLRREAAEKRKLARDVALLQQQAEAQRRQMAAERSQRVQVAALLQAEEAARAEADAQRRRIVQLTQRSADLDAQLESQRQGLLYRGERSAPVHLQTEDSKLHLADTERQRELTGAHKSLQLLGSSGSPMGRLSSSLQYQRPAYDEALQLSAGRRGHRIPNYFTPVRAETVAPVPGSESRTTYATYSPYDGRQPNGEGWEQFSPARILR